MQEDSSEVVLDVECGPNKAQLYVSRLCQGSKGPCVLLNGAWLTPNELQYVSGRETAKDWKRSIRHHGKSLKLLMAKGVLSLQPAVCRCETCEGISPDAGAAAEQESRVAAPAASAVLPELTPKKVERKPDAPKKQNGSVSKATEKNAKAKVGSADKTHKKSPKRETAVVREPAAAKETNNNVCPAADKPTQVEAEISQPKEATSLPLEEKVEEIKPKLEEAQLPLPAIKDEQNVVIPEPLEGTTVLPEMEVDEPKPEVKHLMEPEAPAVEGHKTEKPPADETESIVKCEPETGIVTSTTEEASNEDKKDALPLDSHTENSGEDSKVVPSTLGSKIFAPTSWPPVDKAPAAAVERAATPPVQQIAPATSPSHCDVTPTRTSQEESPVKKSVTPKHHPRNEDKDRKEREKHKERARERERERRREAEQGHRSPDRHSQDKPSSYARDQTSPSSSATASGLCSREEYAYYVQRQQQLYDLYKAHYMQYPMPAAQMPYSYLPLPLPTHSYPRSLPYWVQPYPLAAHPHPWAVPGLVPQSDLCCVKDNTEQSSSEAYSPRKRSYDSMTSPQDLAMDLSAKRLKMADGKPMEFPNLDLSRGYPSPYFGLSGLPTPLYPTAATAQDMDRALMSLHGCTPEELSKGASSSQQYSDYAKALASFPSYLSSHVIGH